MPPRACSRCATASSTPCRSIPSPAARSIRSMPRPARSPTSRLQDGEQLVGSGPVAAGDTVRWIIGDTESGAGAAKKIHILVKPTRPDLHDQSRHQHRPAHLSSRAALDREDLHGLGVLAVSAGPAHRAAPPERRGAGGAPVDAGVDSRRSISATTIDGDTPAVAAAARLRRRRQGLYRIPARHRAGRDAAALRHRPGGDGQLVNYRVRQNYYIVDRLFAAAELRLGGQEQQRRVRIVRTDGRRRL